MPLLDTAFVIDYLRGDADAGRLLDLLQQQTAPLGVCPHTLFELYQGVGLSPNPVEEARNVEGLIKSLLVFPFEMPAVKMAGRLQADLVQRGKTMSLMDLFIGCTAVHHGETLVTRNKKDFAAIPGL